MEQPDPEKGSLARRTRRHGGFLKVNHLRDVALRSASANSSQRQQNEARNEYRDLRASISSSSISGPSGKVPALKKAEDLRGIQTSQEPMSCYFGWFKEGEITVVSAQGTR
jgi:hypothetical protein